MARRLPKRGEVDRSAWSGGGKGGCKAHPNAVRQVQDQGFSRPQECVAHLNAVRQAVSPEEPVRVYGCRIVRAGLGHIPDKNRFVYMIAGTSAGVAFTHRA